MAKMIKVDPLEITTTSIVEQETVTLTLSKDEAETLYSLIDLCSGSSTSPRGMLSDIASVLRNAGCDYIYPSDVRLTGNMHFKDVE